MRHWCGLQAAASSSGGRMSCLCASRPAGRRPCRDPPSCCSTALFQGAPVPPGARESATAESSCNGRAALLGRLAIEMQSVVQHAIAAASLLLCHMAAAACFPPAPAAPLAPMGWLLCQCDPPQTDLLLFRPLSLPSAKLRFSVSTAPCLRP